jgi:hypothetical protein
MKILRIPLRISTLFIVAFLIVSPFSAAYGQLGDGLLNYWSFEGNYNDTASSIPGNASTVADTGTPQLGTTIVAGGPLGQYGNFTRSYVEVTDSADVIAAGESLSISAWFRVGAFDQNWQALISHGEGTDYRIARRAAENTMGYAGGVGDIPGANIGPNINDGGWHHVVAITEAGVSTRLWLDGSLIGTGGVPTLSNNNRGRLMIGGNPGGNTGDAPPTQYRPWNGGIDDVAMWSRPLSPTEIGLLYSGGLANDSLADLLADDTDTDNLPDAYERAITGGNDLTVLNGDGVADADMDGLSDFREYSETNTNPILPDTDGDGLKDGDEVAGNNAASTPSGFGATNPVDADSDDDGLSDGAELSMANGFVTNPNNVDTDGDFSTDKYEIDNMFDPTDPGSKPDVLLVQPSFDPIHSLGMNVQYAPGLAPGWDFQENFYNAGVIINNAAMGNYTVHTTGVPAPNTSTDSVQPYLDHGTGGVLGNNLPFPAGGGDNFTVRANAFVYFTRGGNFLLHHGADDTTYTVIDTGTGSPTIAQNNCCGSFSTSFTIGAPGYYPVDFVFGEQGGGEWLDLGISGPGITGTVPLGDTTSGSPAVFPISFPADDTDGDGIPDAYEESFFPGDLTKLGLGDFDMDGVNDPDEYINRTNPTLKDTDMDGLDDGAEAVAMTDPLNPDSDGDSILDGEEVIPGADGYITNPLLADTDMDGWDDPIEILAGSDPTNPFSVPPPSKLPIEDNFDDGVLNIVDWKTNLSIPQGGASVVEAGGHLTMTGRGYLVTVGEFDPELVGGLRITGQWTFVSADDFLQVVLRSDGVPDPANCCGETANGIEFNVALTDAVKDLQILTRNAGTITVTQGVTGVLTNAAAGMTFDFEIIDDGLGMLSFTMTETGNPANTATSMATVDSDTFAQNFIAFHNRESGRVATLDNLSIASLVDNSAFFITDFRYDAGTEMFSITWPSLESKTYGLFYSVTTQVGDWGSDIDDNIPGAPGMESTTYSFPKSSLPDVPDIFFRVQRN